MLFIIMSKMQFDLDDEESRIVNLVKIFYKLRNKKQAVKKIIKDYGKRIKFSI